MTSRRISVISRLTAILLALACAGLAEAVEGGRETSATELRQAKRMLRQAEEHLALEESDAAVALYEKLIQRFNGSPLGFAAHLGLADHRFALGEYERALEHYTNAARIGSGPRAILNPDQEQRAKALYHVGLCHVSMGNPERCFPAFREVIAVAPGSDLANRAYYHIAQAHHQAGNFTQAISNYRMVGTSLDAEQRASRLLELGKPLSVRLADRDFLVLEGAPIDVVVETDEGDSETLSLTPILPGSEVYVAELPTALGVAQGGDGVIQASGRSRVTLRYRDRHTGDGTQDVDRIQALAVVGTGSAALTDAAYRDQVSAVVVDGGAGMLSIRIGDTDRDTGAAIDEIQVEVVIERPVLAEELEAEQGAEGNAASADVVTEDEEERWIERSRATVTLRESLVERRSSVDLGALGDAEGGTFRTAAADAGMRTGTFTADLPFGTGELVAEVGDRITVRYRDEHHLQGDQPRLREATALVAPGTVSRLMMAGYHLTDSSLKVRKELLRAETSLRIGEVYHDMGLESHANQRFDEALEECRRVGATDGIVDQELREQTLYALWRIFLAKGDLRSAAEACRNLQLQFPASDFIDDSLLDLGRAAVQAGEVDRAVQLFKQVIDLPNGSALAPDAQFEIAELYAAQIESTVNGEVRINGAMRERAISAYRAVFTTYPDSSQATEALRRTGDLYFGERNFVHAIDFFEKILGDYPDSPFLADVLFNLARSYVLKGDAAKSLEMINRLERDHPGYERMATAIKLRAYIQKKMAK